MRDAARDLPPELQGVSVKELVKALGEWTVWPGLWVSCFLLSHEGQSPMVFFDQDSKAARREREKCKKLNDRQINTHENSFFFFNDKNKYCIFIL